ncbi:MFS transporter [Oenococcus oeni]|uniref:Major facilitator superfamily (MFS) profile domain-containing protein n=1 Tax=Oenococcus oeni TaxID=1247 RepID=A0A6N4A4F4_OENOE|nr:MFS transporter [Oenococcus oeni]OIK85136.1 hypothetical protein ATW79_09885 [Oenococcus oeni]OIL07716.1 hypothetical protein ATW92_09260 [Oenococcus oeni]OIL11250.1 hypothetical protein ATW93_09860 [Oenococcus oeni]OIM20404.1 hypothetical protein ATX59_09140 [Oenococcus oeni]SYW13477.1 conserved membrane hypothetical protein [Oenococcus oeni]
MIVSIFVSAVAGGAFLPLFIKNTLHASNNLSNWATSLCVSLSYLIGAILSPFLGRLADKYGAKPWLMRASWGTAIIYLLMTFVQNVTQLIILKMAQGLFVGLMTISGAIVVQIVAKKEVGKSLGFVAQQAVFQQ